MFSYLIAICFRMKMLHNRSNNDTKMKKMFPSSTPKAIAIGSVPEPRTPKGAILHSKGARQWRPLGFEKRDLRGRAPLEKVQEVPLKKRLFNRMKLTHL